MKSKDTKHKIFKIWQMKAKSNWSPGTLSLLYSEHNTFREVYNPISIQCIPKWKPNLSAKTFNSLSMSQQCKSLLKEGGKKSSQVELLIGELILRGGTWIMYASTNHAWHKPELSVLLYVMIRRLNPQFLTCPFSFFKFLFEFFQTTET